MKVLLVNGSPHETGNTYQTLRIISECLDKDGIESEIFQHGSGKVRGCIGCDGCKRKNTEGNTPSKIEGAREDDVPKAQSELAFYVVPISSLSIKSTEII